jgi:hypothetical protein
MSRRTSTRRQRGMLGSPEQLPLGASPKPRAGLEPEQAAKVAVARRARPSPLPNHVRLTLTLHVPRALAERLSARAIREAKNLEAVVIEILKAASR